jgi:UDP-glucose 4-epimerase
MVAGLVRQTRLADMSGEQIQLLTHGRVVDTTQLRETFGFTPRFTTAEAFADFAAAQSRGLLPPERLTSVTDRLAGLLGHGDHHDTEELRPR